MCTACDSLDKIQQVSTLCSEHSIQRGNIDACMLVGVRWRTVLRLETKSW